MTRVTGVRRGFAADAGEPISITINFAGPVTEGEFEISTRAVRTNRSNQHWYLELTQDECDAARAKQADGR